MNKAEIIAIVNRSGGVGKTTTAHTLGAGLHHRGFNVLLVDLESQCNLTFFTGARADGLTSWDVLTGSAPARDAIQHTASGDVIAGSPQLDNANTEIQGARKEYRLKDALAPLLADYDYIFIDTPPTLGAVMVNALTASDSCIIPAHAEAKSVQGIPLIIDVIRATQSRSNPALKVKGILITDYEGGTKLAQSKRDQLAGIAVILRTKFYNPIRHYVAIKESQDLQQDIFTYSPRSNIAHDYKAVIDDILTESDTMKRD